MLKTRKSRVLLTTAFAAAVLFFGIEKSILPGAPQKPSPRESFKVMERVIGYIKADYLEEPDAKKIMDGAFQGLVNSLDVLSGYLDKPSAATYAAAVKAPIKDIGVVLFKQPNAFPLVVGVIENSPAAKAGLRVGDYLSAVDDFSTIVWSLTEAEVRLKDPAGGKVKLRVIRDNGTKEMDIERAAIYAKPFTMSAQKGTAGVVRIHHLFAPLAAEFRKTVLPGLTPAAGPLVLDLRDCHEGDVAEAAAFLNIFLKAEKIGYFEKKGGTKDYLGCPGAPALQTQPLAVWVNQATIGPAEIAAAVLGDQKRSKVVGLATPGLTGRQELFPLDQGDALVLTTAVFCFPSGDKLWRKGVTPDVKIDIRKMETKDYLEKTPGLAPVR
jgi:carboxyl-terminal processing protease